MFGVLGYAFTTAIGASQLVGYGSYADAELLYQRCKTGEALSGGATNQTSVAKLAQDYSDGASCYAYIAGYIAALDVAAGTGSKKLICTKRITLGRVVTTFLHYADSHPGEMRMEAEYVLWNSLVHAFPCPR